MDRHELKSKFLEEWPIERLENLQLDEYTNLDKSTSFCYWLEARTNDLGSIWGGSAYKFGIYRKSNPNADARIHYESDGTYSWHSKYGRSAQEAFQSIKAIIVRIAEEAQRNNLIAIDAIDLGNAYKWKIAFLYSDYNIINIFNRDSLVKAAQLKGMQGVNKETSISSMHTYLITQKPQNEDFYEYTHALWSSIGENPEKPVVITTSMENLKPKSLNSILFGPPGTGKTYHTINKAIAIANPDFDFVDKTRKQIKEEYERLQANDQIAFVTFHQSLSYEDFIEGIKPVKPQDGDSYLKYIVEDGIFKLICKNARYKPDAQTSKFHLTDEEFKRTSFFKISLGNTLSPEDNEIYQYCIQHNCIALGWGGMVDFTGLSEAETINHAKANGMQGFEITALNSFKNYLKTGNYVLVSNGNYSCRAIGKVTGDYLFNGSNEIDYHQLRPVEWLVKDVDIPVSEIYHKAFSQQSIYKLDKQNIKQDFFVKTASNQINKIPSKPKNYVLIIDEINRGNVSQIFGELITLIEDDKREGEPEALSVILPYSKQIFSVPGNVYIIGTMNTADRSVEALDTALRRRFSFVEMLPKPELITPQQMIWKLWIEHEKLDWKEEPFLSNEQSLYKLLGATELLILQDNEKDVYWDKIVNDKSDSSVFDDFNFIGVNFKDLLEKINCRLEKLISRDHMIGHSFFLNVNTSTQLYRAFFNKIIPQLQEYFFGDYGKIGLVLGAKFIESVPAVTFAKFEYEDQDMLLEKKVYRLKSFLYPDGNIDEDDFVDAVKSI